ncbi:hypothetical protein SAMN05421766_10743 [Zobellia uliginosa]|uniref:Uncharacterized protein n=1 Tax=Zobellia uliginosa TaxID=143224 RepID=A0ABY1L0G7_9FLAO|nr:hypothetical protein SAMN05421766_10743 [Zobellia uliginosa]
MRTVHSKNRYKLKRELSKIFLVAFIFLDNAMITITKVTWTVLVKYRIRDLLVIPNGGGADMKFWAHLDHWAK